MYNTRWFKALAACVLLASVALTVSPVGAAFPLVASSNCEAAIRQGSGTVMPSQLSDRELCYVLKPIQGSPAAMTVSAADNSVVRQPGLAAPAASMPDRADYIFRITTHVAGNGQ